ncbi:pyroglutamyl-peptidase I [Chromobacterium phragmitis]|uniref:Pyrrolidone-carboxylate peptidase n=1 Tax=Chromobacterium phragmitis TaxID=2202141 RepID=A0A344UF62_9NEIS|nr:pyroglutamyl-peptidase I [Chromobacterium phragmitis]AXE28586.1 pyroglutamyl-peptidase I [Chromobacterium phragmitis]AXE33910.1 pyroglutamyl-peptidase I [Chromobacterium phragmitis]
MKTVLLTGFEPFGGETVNPSWETVRRLDGEIIAGARVSARRLPCAFGAALDELRRQLDALHPDVAIAVGQAGGRSDIAVERVAINIDDARFPDNDGKQPIDVPVIPNAPAAYFSTLPIKAIVAALRERGLPATVSQTAGTFVCNHAMYGLLHHGAPQAGFIHLPFLPEQAARHPGAFSLSLDDGVAALRIAVETSLSRADDLVLSCGATH